jgi:pre-peptidase
MNKYLRYAVGAAFAAGSLATSVAHAIEEIEGPSGNGSIGTAMHLTPVNGSVEVTGVLGVTSSSIAAVNDLDFYSFDATEGDVVQIDIDGAMRNDCGPMSVTRCADTVIAVFSADGTMWRTSDDYENPDGSMTPDPGSDSTNDAFIVDFVVPATGRYFVGVAGTGGVKPRIWDTGPTIGPEVDPNTGNGSYTLVISGVNTPPPVAETPPPPAEEPPPPVVTPAPPGQAKKVNIDIRPRHPGVTKVYPNADGRISVAILSSSTFDAMKVDRSSLKFGAEGNELSFVGCYKEGIDVNRDRRKDLVCRFDAKKAGFDVGDLEGIVTGTAEGSQFEGRGPVKVVMKGKKRKHQHNHGHDYDNRGHGGGWQSRRD